MKIDSLRLILEKCNDPYVNLSIEEAILHGVNEGYAPDTLRLWVNTPSLIIGSGQVGCSPNFDLCFQRGIYVARRMSGGGAVYHDEGNLNWSFTAKREGGSQDILWGYEYFGTLIAESLKPLELQAYFVKPNSIVVNGKKISGMAGHFKPHAFLIHGTLLVNSDLELLNQICPPVANAPPVTSLEEALKHRVEVKTVIRMILSFLHGKGIRTKLSELTPGEAELARNLCIQKYSLYSWNFDLLMSHS